MEKKIKNINQNNNKVGVWLLSTALPLINIYVCSKFNFKPFGTFQDMTRTSNHYEKNGLRLNTL